jgi:hypothetical protein
MNGPFTDLYLHTGRLLDPPVESQAGLDSRCPAFNHSYNSFPPGHTG